MKKNSYTTNNPKKHLCKGQKKIHTREMFSKKIHAVPEFPIVPTTFLKPVRPRSPYQTTGSPSSKYDYRRASALLRNILNMGMTKMGNKNDRISIKKNSLPYLKCVLNFSCVVHRPIYDRFMRCSVNGFLSIYIRFTKVGDSSGAARRIQREKTVYSATHKTAINRPMDHTGEM